MVNMHIFPELSLLRYTVVVFVDRLAQRVLGSQFVSQATAAKKEDRRHTMR